jgi:hypothetical protein
MDRVADKASNPKVGQLAIASHRQEHVRRLNVPMHDTGIVYHVEHTAKLPDDRDSDHTFDERERVGERYAIDILENEEVPALNLEHLTNGDKRRMSQRLHDARFSGETVPRNQILDVRVQMLHRDNLAGHLMASEIHHTGRPATQDTNQLVVGK